MNPLEHVASGHDTSLVLLAMAVCLVGGWATSRFFPRIVATSGGQRGGWAVLTALTCGVSAWCTHFIAMLAHNSSATVELDGPLTMLSLIVAILGIGVGLAIAGARPSRSASVLGGLVVGAAVAGMHYTGMAAYRTEGAVTWDVALVVLSNVFSLTLPPAAMLAARRGDELGRNAQWLLLSGAVLLLHFTGMAGFATAAGHAHGTGLPSELQMLVIFIAVLGLVVVVSGVAGYLIDDRVRAERDKQLRALTELDPLTALPNRLGFAARLDDEFEKANERGHGLTLFSIDLHGFRAVNDLRGRGAGDELLRATGRRLAELVDEQHGVFVARVGGDEFAAIVRAEHDVDEFLQRLERAVTAEAAVGARGVEHLPGAAIGVALFPEDAVTAKDLVSASELALDRSKADELHRPCFADRSNDQRIRMRRELATDLRHARERDELRLRYQPQVAVADGRVVGHRILLHWEHPVYGPVLQDELVRIAEPHGLLAELLDWALRAAARDAAGWAPEQRLVIGVPAQLLRRPGIVALLRDALDAAGLAPDRLEIALHGAGALDGTSLAALRSIAATGAGVGLADFATGGSSLALLRSFPFDRLSIDAAVIAADDEPGLRQAGEVVSAIAALGRALGVAVCAEGVTSASQLALLRSAGVELAEGPLIGRPVRPTALAAAAEASNG